MDAADLQHGFRIGDWLVEPQSRRAASGDRTVELDGDPLRLLLALAARHGESIERRTLRQQLWPGQPDSDVRLRDAVARLRELFGDTARHRRHLASVGHDALALIAHFEPLSRPEPPAASPPGESLFGKRLHWLLGEMRRRNVLKAAASYLVGMWVLLQVAQVTFAPLQLPDWWMTVLTILAIIGLPIVVALAWTYEITAQGIVLDPGDGAAAVRLPKARQSLAPAIVAGVALMAAVTGFAWWRSLESRAVATADSTSLEAAEVAGPPSIAVLPFVDLSPGAGDEWLGDGLSEELSTRLAQVPGLRVAARTSAFEFKGKNVDVRKIGQALGVRHVLEGSVRREGDAVRVTVQLIETRSGYHAWAGTFDRPWRDLLALQADVARSVTDALQVVLSDAAAPGAAGAATAATGPVAAGMTVVDTRALDPYLRGLALLRQPGDASTLDRADESFRAAIDIAPQFAAAHAGLCRVLSRRYGHSFDPAALAEAETACRRALELDATLVDTERALGALYISSDRFREASDVYRRMLAANPADAEAQLGLGEALEGLGLDEEAERSLRRAITLDPADWDAQSALGSFLFHRGRLDEAIVSFTRATELAPGSANAWSNLGGAAQMRGDMDRALDAYQKSLRLEESATAYSNLATAQYFTGRYADAIANYERALALSPHDQTLRGNLADALWLVDARRNEALELYEEAIGTAEATLAKNPADATLRAQLGFYYGRTGDFQRSRLYLEGAVQEGGEMMYVQYYRAVAAADRGDRETALAAVAELLRIGYPRTMLRMAPEFRALSQDPEYARLMRDEEAA